MSFLEQLPYPAGDPRAQPLEDLLAALYPSDDEAFAFLENQGLDVSKIPQSVRGKNVPDMWQELLKRCSANGLTRKVVSAAKAAYPSNPKVDVFDKLLAEEPPPPTVRDPRRIEFNRDAVAWMFRARPIWIAIVLAPIAFTIASMLCAGTTSSAWAAAFGVYMPLVANLVVAATFLAFLPRKIDELASPVTKASVRALRDQWRLVLSFWVILYLIYIARRLVESYAELDFAQLVAATNQTHQLGGVVQSILDIVAHAFRNANALLLFAAFYEMSQKTIDEQGEHTGARPSLATGIVVVGVFAAIEVFLLVCTEPEAKAHYSPALAFDTICWMVTAACLALFVARLESQFIAVPHTLLLVFYTYCGLQALGPFLNLPFGETLRPIVYSLAMVFKLLLCAVMQWFFVRRASFFFSSARELYNIVPPRYEEFQQTKGNKDTEYGVFLSAPLSPRDVAARATALSIFTQIQQAITDSYGVRTLIPPARPGRDDGAVVVRRENFFAIRRARVFVLIFDVRHPSSALIELGVAFSHFRPVLIYYLEDNALPTLAQPGNHGKVRAHQVSTLAEIPQRIADDLTEFLGR